MSSKVAAAAPAPAKTAAPAETPTTAKAPAPAKAPEAGTASDASFTAPEPTFGFLDQGIEDFYSSLNLEELAKGEVPEDSDGPAEVGLAAPTAGTAGAPKAANTGSGMGGVYVDLLQSYGPQAALWGVKNFGMQGVHAVTSAILNQAKK